MIDRMMWDLFRVSGQDRIKSGRAGRVIGALHMDRRSFFGVSPGAATRLALGDSPDPAGMTLKKAADSLRTKAVSSVDLTRACLARIDKYQPVLNAFITVTGEQ